MFSRFTMSLVSVVVHADLIAELPTDVASGAAIAAGHFFACIPISSLPTISTDDVIAIPAPIAIVSDDGH